jgi:hypothetical protein
MYTVVLIEAWAIVAIYACAAIAAYVRPITLTTEDK